MKMRAPRFKTPSHRLLQPTERDVEILRQVYKHRFVRSSHLTSLLGGSPQGILRRLTALHRDGYLERLSIRRQREVHGGSDPRVYSLGVRGKDFLKGLSAVLPRRLTWLASHQIDVRDSLEHALMVTDVMVGIERACKDAGTIRFIDPAEIAATVFGGDSAQENRANVFRWRAVIENRGMPVRVEVIPDQVFGLQFPERPTGHDTVYFFLEADRGTMPVKRKDIERSSFHRKLQAYHGSWLQMVPQQLFGFQRYRVMTVTSSAERLAHLVEANQQFNLGRGSGLFLFADHATLRQHDDLLTLPFRTGRGSSSRLIEG
jgi:Replication-relaxation